MGRGEGSPHFLDISQCYGVLIGLVLGSKVLKKQAWIKVKELRSAAISPEMNTNKWYHNGIRIYHVSRVSDIVFQITPLPSLYDQSPKSSNCSILLIVLSDANKNV